MLFERIAVETSNLSIGMYVGMLDRPWLETPFVFQGFEIRDRSEIEQLQRYCSYVYVDISRGNLTQAQLVSLNNARSKDPFRNNPIARRSSSVRTWLNRLRSGASWLGLEGFLSARLPKEFGGKKTTATMRAEAPRATAAYELNLSQYELIVEGARTQGKVKLDTVINTVTPTIKSILRNPDAMAWTVFSRKKSGQDYSRAVATSVWSVMFGHHLGFEREQLQDLAIGGLLLDIGNVRLPADILNTSGALTDEQREKMQRHVQIGVEILEASKDFPDNVFDMVRHHHERADGSGYPDKLRGSSIPIFGRIAGIADCYDAMTTKNAYSSAEAAYGSARKLHDMRGKQFQAEVVEQFFRTVGMFPTGSVVELSDGTVGVVLEQNRTNALRPKVMLLLDKTHKPFSPRRVLDMKKLPAKPNSEGAICIDRGHAHGAFGIDPLELFK